MTTILSDIEVRILGCLLEKKLATPEYYPLSLNALVNACNQKTNRFPVVSYDETTVINGIQGLVEKKLVGRSELSRVTKYEELLTQSKNLVSRETSILCILLVRGPQTIGEIKSRTERLYRFESLEDVGSIIATLEEWGLVMRLPRMKGHKEPRYIHLFSEVDDMSENFGGESFQENGFQMDAGVNDRISGLEERIDVLTRELDEFKKAFSDFKKQFD